MPLNDINHRPPRVWNKVSITLDRQLAEITTGFLGTMDIDGLELASDFTDTPPEDDETISIYFGAQADLNHALGEINTFIDNLQRNHPNLPSIKLECQRVVEEDWNKTWREHFQPVEISQRLVIKPSWESYQAKEGQRVIEMDPGMAFGTGLHATTQLSLLLIETLYPPKETGPSPVLDIGTGTGVLGMSAALLGADEVMGIDNDDDAVQAAAKNVKLNGLASQMSVSGAELQKIERTFTLVIANIIHNTLIELKSEISSKVASGGHLILSGILKGEQHANIVRQYEAQGLRPDQVMERGEWSAVSMKRD